jgi:plastocyanin
VKPFTATATTLLYLLCALAAAGGSSALGALPSTQTSRRASPAMPASVHGGAAHRGHATKRSRCAKRRRSKHAQRCCHARHHSAARAVSAPVTPAPLSTAALLSTPTAISAPSLAPIVDPAASSPAPATEPRGVSTPSEPPVETEPPSVPHVQVSAAEYYFTLSRTSVPAGEVILQFVNDGQDEHNLQIAEAEAGPLVGAFADTPSKGVGQLQLEMRSGSYTLFCSLHGHEAKGMKATLTVE